jgi:two-component system cell cycle response regulator
MARILIIEDNPTNLELMSYLLKAFGHEVLTAMDGAEGIEAVRRSTVELILCDVQLPKLDGFGVVAHLKSQPALRSIPIVAVTALAMVGDRDKLLAAGFDGYLSKPIDPETFVSAVVAFLSSERAAPQVVEQTSSTHRQCRGATILIVDNSPVNLLLAQSVLEPFGYQVTITHSVKEGLETARRIHPHLILSDVHMPDESGFDLIRAVKSDTQLRSIPFVFISSTAWRDNDRQNGLALGAMKFILRPIDPQILVKTIEDCLEKH